MEPESRKNNESGLHSIPPDACPLCGKTGKEIPRKILFQNLEPGEIPNIISWRRCFVCLTSSCECLYYSAWRWISHKRCVKKVGFKLQSSPRTWCYCFSHTDLDILKQRTSGGVQTYLKEIENYASQGSLLCEHTNPTGECCLSMIRDSLQDLETEKNP